MSAALFHREAADGVQELKLDHDKARDSLVLRIGSGRKKRSVRLPKTEPLAKAQQLDGVDAFPDRLVEIIMNWAAESNGSVSQKPPNT